MLQTPVRIWKCATFFISDETWQTQVAAFFLGCIAVAGIYGALSADKKIFWVQAAPALLALALLLYR